MKKIIMMLSVLSLLTGLAIAGETQSSVSGLVVDQNNNPVAGVTVNAVITAAGISQSKDLLKTQTDQNGNFAFSNVTADIKVTTIKKDGYICNRYQVQKTNDTFTDLFASSEGSDPQSILIRIHKKSGPVFLKKKASQFTVKAKGQNDLYLDMKNGADISKIVTKNIAKDKSEKLDNVLRIQNVLDSTQQTYQLTLTCIEEGIGVIVSDELLYEAPMDGYTSQASLNISYSDPKPSQTKRYLYLKANGKEKDQFIYSRVDFEFLAGKAELIADTQIWTNPKGERSFEYDEKFQQKYISDQLEEIRTAIEENTATEEQIQEMHELMMAKRELDQNRWDFDGNRRRAIQKKLEKERTATGRLRPKERDIQEKN
jgi:hypothetical protein